MATATAPNRLMVTIREAADMCGCSMKSIRGLISRGDLPVVRVGYGRRSIRIYVSDLAGLAERPVPRDST